MADAPAPALRDCLAYAAICNGPSWLGDPSPRSLELFLAGAAMRASLTAAAVSEWQVYGPLEQPQVYLPLVARTGHPALTIKWSTALELHHLSMQDAMDELKTILESADREAFPDCQQPLLSRWPNRAAETLASILQRLAARPAMFLGRTSGWGLWCYLAGMDRGGDWLAMPALAGLSSVVKSIADQSLAAYGSPFGAYRVYEDPSELLSWAGIRPG